MAPLSFVDRAAVAPARLLRERTDSTVGPARAPPAPGAVLCVAIVHAQGPTAAAPPVTETFTTVESQKAFVAANCAGCHNSRVKAGDYDWGTIDLAQPAEHAEHLEKAILKLRAGLMPPPGPRRPSDETLQAFAAVLEARVDQAAAASPRPGRVRPGVLEAVDVRDVLVVERGEDLRFALEPTQSFGIHGDSR